MCLFITVTATVLINWQRKKNSSALCCGHVLMWVVTWCARQNISGVDKDILFLKQLIHKIMPVDVDFRVIWVLKIRAALLKGLIRQIAKITARNSVMP
jgi:hypothetical protein